MKAELKRTLVGIGKPRLATPEVGLETLVAAPGTLPFGPCSDTEIALAELEIEIVFRPGLPDEAVAVTRRRRR